jgi:polysaccharide biosynthesis protein PslG
MFAWLTAAARRTAVAAAVALSTLCTGTGVPAATAGLVPAPVGVQFHGMWSMYSDTQRAYVLDKLQSAGVTSVRLDVSWAMLQPTSATSYDAWGTGFVDRVIGMANARGIKPLVTLWLTPAWANRGAGDRVLPTNPADYARAAGWAAARWRGKVTGWEVWNEENSSAFMAGADPSAYVKLLRAAYPALKAGDPSVPVVFGGLEYNDTGWLSRAYDAGARGSFDVLATHPYQGMADLAPTAPDDGTIWRLSHAAAVHALMVARGDGAKPIWFTEFGWSTHATAPGAPNWDRGVSETTQSTYLSQTASYVRQQMPYVTRLYWYDDRDMSTGNIQYDNYGLFRLNLSTKPALSALAAANGKVALAGAATRAVSRPTSNHARLTSSGFRRG